MRRAQSLVHCDAGAAGGRAIPIFGYAWTDLQGGLGWVRCPRVSEDVHAHGEPSTACHPCGPWLPLIPSYRLVEEGGDILFLVPVCCTEHHHSILDGECIEVVQHDVVGLRKQCWVTLRDKGRREQVGFRSQNGPCPLFHGLVGVAKERSQALLVDLASQAGQCELWR